MAVAAILQAKSERLHSTHSCRQAHARLPAIADKAQSMQIGPDMPIAETEDTSAKLWARASIVNSLLLFAAAAAQLNATFWVLAVTNFALMHAVWVVQLVRRRHWGAVDFRPFKWPLIAFGVLGNAALLLWGERLLAVFPA